MKKSFIFCMTFTFVLLFLQFQVSAEPVKPLSQKDRDAYAELSPFEFKDFLIKKASEKQLPVLNAGRGNPNFINTRARLAFSMLQDFAVSVSAGSGINKDLAYPPQDKEGISDKFKKHLAEQADIQTAEFLLQSMDYSNNKLAIQPDSFVADMVDAILGDHYPTPSKMLTTPARIVEGYLKSIHFPGNRESDSEFDLFATEGATAAMIYVFNTLKENFLLIPGDNIAIITPVFSPYLEIPVLNDYKLKPIYVKGSETTGWQIPEEELNKLKNKEIKALFMVNPMNPGAASMSRESVEKIGAIIKQERSDLIVLTDTVYCPFVDEFHDLLELVPENCIGVYSYSKYFGVTGWRLGVVFVQRENIFDKMIKNLSLDHKKKLRARYSTVSTEPDNISFIDRLLIDSRYVALAHTGGLSTPQQCVMALFSLYDLMDKNKGYKKSIQALLNKRMTNLYRPMKMPPPKGSDQTMYYNMVNIKTLAEHLYGKAFADYLTTTYTPFGFLLALSSRYQTVLLPGVGFAGPEWSVRVSLANLPDDDYIKIGENIVSLINEYYKGWK